MFDLELSIAAWRRMLSNNPALVGDDIDELVQHLRDQVAALRAEGLSQEEAFRRALVLMGDYATVEREYGKVYWGKRRRRGELVHELVWRTAMLKNYLKIAWRTLFRQKGYAFINVTGLSVGLACSFFILLWVMHEVSVDRFHERGDRIYRVLRHETINGEVFTKTVTPGPLGAALTNDYPEIENATITRLDQEFLVTYDGESFREQGNHVSADFFDVFTFPLLQGNPATALQSAKAVVISERLAANLFGADWQKHGVLGKSINIDHEKDVTITAVARDVPDNSTIRFDVLLPIREFFATREWTQQWGNNSFPVYVLLKEGASLADANAKIAGVMQQHGEQDEAVFLYPFEDMYLHGRFEHGFNTGGRIDLVRIFVVVAVFLLVIASINFMNLATARSTQRSKEIGIRKAIGSTQRSLGAQFLTETMLLVAVAFVLALVFVIGLLPAFNTVTGTNVGLLDLSPVFLAAMFGIALLTGLLTGSYPAFYLSSFNPVVTLRGTFRQKPGEARLRKGLVVFQFALSTLILVSTATVYVQIRYIMEEDLGLDRGHLVSVELEGGVQERYELFRQELLEKPGIVNVTTCDPDPLSINYFSSDPSWEGKDSDNQTEMAIIRVGYDFVETMQMELIAGRTHSRQFGTDAGGYVINEQMAKLMGKEDPVGARLTVWGQEGPVLGVVKDFHMATFDTPISPTIIVLNDDTERVWVRTEAGKTQEALASLKAVYEEFNPSYPFSYRFMDQEYEAMYRSVRVMGRLANVFAVIATLISCLGLFGLASFTAARRTKEIGVRKVLGASVSGIVGLLSKDFLQLVGVGFLIAVPLTYFAMQRWLDSFAYHIELSLGVYLLTGTLLLVIALLTVSCQAIKAALADPVKSLRYE